jgi:hypothetical protein
LTALFRDLILVRQVLPFGYERPAEVAESLTSWSHVVLLPLGLPLTAPKQ